VYKFAYSGLGSNMMNMFAKMVYLGENYSRTVIAVESQYGYRRNDSVGVLTGFFSPTFHVIDRIEQHAEIDKELRCTSISTFETKRGPSSNHDDDPIWMTALYEYREEIFKTYEISSTSFYNKVLEYACPHLKFNPETIQDIQALKKNYSIPNFRSSSMQSVAMHVRRTDKVNTESRLYKGEEYVAKIHSIAPNVTFDHCYVMTDDVAAVEEVKMALEASNILCHVHTMSHKAQNPANRDTTEETIALLAEFSILMDVTYFIGTFNSNIGGLVAIMRGCVRDEPHYSHSYGVDRDNWYII
jgi:Alpha-(1,6)-fucosyltransferase N- and catalytic domains